jgi:hypothetical protein
VLTDEREQLLRGYQKSDGINKAKQSQNDKARELVIFSSGEKSFEKIAISHSRPMLGTMLLQTNSFQALMLNEPSLKVNGGAYVVSTKRAL